MAGMKPQEYCELAQQAEELLQEEMVAYCHRNGFDPVVVPHQDFEKTFEHGTQRFKQWYQERYPAADVMIVTGVKNLDSAVRKSQFNPEHADTHKDYLRGMFVFLNGTTPRKHRASMDAMVRSLNAIESDPLTVAHNNLFHTPKKNGFRGHKAAWHLEVPEDKPLGGLPIIASIKTEHEYQMDIDKLTRRFLTMGRRTQSVLTQFFQSCAFTHELNRSISKSMGKVNDRAQVLTDLGKDLYDHVHDQGGFNALISREALERHAPPSPDKLSHTIREVVPSFGGGSRDLARHIVESGVLPMHVIVKSGLIPSAMR